MSVNVVSADRVKCDWNDNRYIEAEPTCDFRGRLVGPTGWYCRAKQLKPRLEAFEHGLAIAIDCEGVILDDETSICKKGCGRFSVVSENGTVIYDTFVYYPEDVPHRPPPQRLNLGVKYPDILRCNGAQSIAEVTKMAEQIFSKAGIIVGHAIENEFHMLRGVKWDDHQPKIHDTQLLPEYRRYNGGRPAKLDVLAAELLNRHGLQAYGHSSVKDARATMKLYLLRRDAIDSNNGYGSSPDPSAENKDEEDSWGLSSSDDADEWWSAPLEAESSHTPATTSASEDLHTVEEPIHTPAFDTTIAPHQSVATAALRTQISNTRVALPNLPELAALVPNKRWNPMTSRYI